MLFPSDGATWDHSVHLNGAHYELARIYASGASLSDVCPGPLQEQWHNITMTLKSCLKAFKTASLLLDQNCLYDAIPEYFLFEYLTTKNKITQHVLDTYPKPKNYKFMYNLLEMLSDIRRREVHIDTAPIVHLLSSTRGKNFLRTLHTARPICNYNPWGTVTGRLATSPNSFPLLTMSKEFRACVRPTNDWFIELDFNGAELRTLLALTGEEQPREDIHDWNAKNIYGGTITRDEAKKRIFAWMYNPKSQDSLSSGAYNKELVKNKYWDGCKIETDYYRIMDNVDEHHALNYIVQSTTIDMVHEQAHKVFELLRGRKSNISFLIHDAVYIDLAEEDRYDILNILDTFKKTRYGTLKVNVGAGRNLGEIKELKL